MVNLRAYVGCKNFIWSSKKHRLISGSPRCNAALSMRKNGNYERHGNELAKHCNDLVHLHSIVQCLNASSEGQASRESGND